MADANVRLTADTSDLESGIKRSIDLMNTLSDNQRKVSNEIDSSINSQIASRKKAVKGLEDESKAMKRELGIIEKIELELSVLNTKKRQAFDGDEVKEFSKEIKKLEKELGVLNGEIEETTKPRKKGFFENTFGDFGSKIKDFVLSPLGLVTIAVGAIGKQFFDLGSQLEQTTQITNTLFGDTNEDLESIRKEAILVANIFDKDVNEVLLSANSVSKSFGISADESLALIREGIEKGADVNGEFLDQLKEYPTQFKLAGLSAEESIAIITQQVKSGVFSDKGVDAIKEATISLRELTPATEEALASIGISGSEVQKQIQDGTRTYFDVIQEISSKTKEFGEDSAEAGVILADVFRGAGEDAGSFIFSLGDLNTNLSTVQDTGSSLDRGIARLKDVFQGFFIDLIQGSSVITRIGEALLSFANRLDNLIQGVQEFNLNRLTSSFLDLIDTVTLGTTQLGKYADELREFEDLTDDIIDAVQGEVESISTLTTNLDENNKKLQDSNLSTEEANKIKEENKKIVEELNERYPEFTKNLDLQSASTEELNRLTKELTDSLIEQAGEQIKAQKRQEGLKRIFDAQINVNRAVRDSKDAYIDLGFGVRNAKNELEDALKSFNNIDDSVDEAVSNIKGLDLELNTTAKSIVDTVTQAERQLNILKARSLIFDSDALQEQIEAQKKVVEDARKEQQDALDKELGVNLDKEVESTKKEEEEKAKIIKSARNKIESEELKQAQKLADERRKILEYSENEYNKNISDLLDQRTELYAESEADKILLEESRALQSIDNLKANILEEQALLQLASDRGQEFIEQSTQEELNAELEKYRQKVTLTSEQEEAIRDLKLDISNRTQQDLLALELKNQSELLSLSEETTNKKIQLQEQLENSAIERINNNEELSEIQKEANILQIRQDGLEQRKSLIEEETRLKNEQINKEIELLKSLNTEESNLKIQSLEVQKEINNQQLSDQIQSYDNQIEAGKQAVIEAQQVAEQSTLDNAIGKIFGVDSPEQIQAIKDTFKTLVDNLVSIYSQGLQRQLESNERLIDGINQRIDEQESAVDREIQKNKEGNASSIALEEEKLANLQEQRDNALKQQEEIIRRQQQLEDLQQLSALITSSANIIKSTSVLPPPFNVLTATASIGAMFALFAKTKSDANNSVKLEEGGTIKAGDNKVIQGKRHSQGGEDFLKHVEIEQGEMVSVFNRKATSNFGKEIVNFANMVNSGKKPILPNGEVVKNLQNKESNLAINLNSKFDSKELKENNKKMDKLIDLLSNQSQMISSNGYTTVRKGNVTRTVKKG